MNRVNLFVTVGTGRFITLTYFVTGGFILATLFTQLSIYYNKLAYFIPTMLIHWDRYIFTAVSLYRQQPIHD